jgi:AraC-like DNA-binding protein
VTFANPSPGDLGELSEVFGGNLRFDEPETSIEIELELLDVTIGGGDPGLFSILLRHADELLSAITRSESFEAQVRLGILERLGEGLPSAESIAGLLSMSLSGFKRRLREEGLSYRGLRNEVVVQVSQQLLRETNLEVGAIALEMGYSEHSAFGRAFARICGVSPVEYRRKAGADRLAGAGQGLD